MTHRERLQSGHEIALVCIDPPGGDLPRRWKATCCGKVYGSAAEASAAKCEAVLAGGGEGTR